MVGDAHDTTAHKPLSTFCENAVRLNPALRVYPSTFFCVWPVLSQRRPMVLQGNTPDLKDLVTVPPVNQVR